MGPVRRSVALLLAALVTAAVGCGSDGSEVPLDGEPAEMLAAAVERSHGAVRLRVHATTDAEVMVATESAEGVVTPDGDVHVDLTLGFEQAEGYEDVAPLAERAARAGTTEVISVGNVTYRRVTEDGPVPGGATLPPGVEWISAPRGTAPELSDLDAYLSTRGLLDLVAGAASVEDAGPTEVDDVPVRWLKAVAGGDGKLAGLVGDGTTIDVAVDGAGLVRRIAFRPERTDGLATQVIVDLHEFGVETTIEPPPADVTIDRSELGG